MAAAAAGADTMTDDERLARQLQEAEMGQAGAPARPAVVVGSVGPGGPGGPGAAAYGAPVAYGVPVRAGGLPPPYAYPYSAGIGIVGTEEEVIVLSYRRALICFATIDAFSTLLNGISSVLTVTRYHSRHGENRWYIPLIGLIFLIGPLCGIIGAKSLKRGFVGVYLFFCVVKTAFEVALVIVTPYLWFLILALIQMWITKVVFTFWRALGGVPRHQRPALLEKKDMAHMVYW